MGVLEFSQSLAIAIGINQYSHGIPTLGTPVSDARAIAHTLQTDHGYTIQLLTDEQATCQTLTHLIHETLPQQIQPNDRLIFYFAGHGIALNGDNGPEGFLIPQDARLGNTQTYLSMAALQQALTALPCRHFLAIFDCCFAGAFRWATRTRDISFVPDVIHQERYDRFLIDPAWQVITSTAYDQTALDAFTFQDARGQQGNHSPFALALLESLAGQADTSPPATTTTPQGDGVITATELYLYLRDRVEAPTYQSGQRQTPSLFPLGKHNKGEYIFLTPGHVLNLPPAPPLDPSQNPYRGLASFEEEQADLFFGRRDRITELHQRICDRALTVVVGSSGSGKSSLVKAGVLPQFRADSNWQIIGPVRPGNTPLALLKKVIRDIRGDRDRTNNSTVELNVESLADASLADASLADAIEHWHQTHPEKCLLWVIDQFEELLTLGCDEASRSLFLAILERAVIGQNTSHFRLVLTLRADFEPYFRDNAKDSFQVNDILWNEARFVLPPMTRADLREAIEQPANAKVMYFQSEDPRHPFVEQLIDEVADMPGALPLLSFTLSELYLKFLERQQIAQQQGITIDRAILEADYQNMGGVVRSLTQRADQEYEALVQQNSDYAHTICHVMLRMVALGSGEVTRRRVPLSELVYPGAENERAKTVIARFSAARLLVEGQDLAGQPYVEPAHDALVSGWTRLLTWQREEENLLLQRRLTPAALDWHRAQKARFLWNSDPRLEILHQVLKLPHHWLNQVETEFIQRSVARKRFNNRLWISGTISVILLLSAGLIASILGQRQARINEARADRTAARVSLENNHSLEGLVNSLKAGQLLQSPLLRLLRPQKQLRRQISATLQWATYHVSEQNRMLGHSGPVRSQWSPDGNHIASAGEDGWIRLWTSEGQAITGWPTGSRRLLHLSFSPDGQWIVSAGEDGILRLWDLTGEPLSTFAGHQGTVNHVSFSPDGQQLASVGGDDGKAFLWNISLRKDAAVPPFAVWQVTSGMAKSIYFHPTQPWVVTTDPQSIQIRDFRGRLLHRFAQHAWIAQFTPDGQRVVAAGDDGNVGIWEIATGDRIHVWRADSQRLWYLTLSSDGQQIATAGEEGIVKLWTPSGKPLGEFRQHSGPARRVSFSPDASRLVSAGDDSSTRIWMLQTQASRQFSRTAERSETAGDGEALGRIQWVANGEQLVGRDSNGQLRFWTLAGNPLATPTPERLANNPTLQDIDVDETGNRLASLDTEGGISVQSLTQPEKALRVRLPSRNARDNLALSPDGQWLASTSQGKDILLLNTSQNQSQRLSGEGESISRLTFSSNGRWLAAAGANGLIEVWDVKTRRVVQQLQEHIGQVHSLDFSPTESQRLVSAGADGTVRQWNVETGRSVGSPYQVYGQPVLAVAFSTDGLVVVSGDRSGAIQLWDTMSSERLATWQAHPQAIQDARFSPNNQQLVTAGREGNIKIWPLASFEQLMVQGCERIRPYLENQIEAKEKALCQDF